MKKIISLLCLVLAACSSNNTPPAHDNTKPFHLYMTHLGDEKIFIRSIIKTPDNKTYLLITKIMSFQALMRFIYNLYSSLNT